MNEPIRVLQVVAKMNRAGTETMLMNYYRHIDRERVQFDFAVCTNEKCDYEDEIISLGGKIFRYPRYTGKNHFRYNKWWTQLFDQHPEYRIIHGHIGSTAAIYLGMAKKRGLYTIAHSHGTKEPLSIRSLLYGFLSYRTRYIADWFFGCSMQAIIDRYGKKIALSNRAQVLNNAIDAKAYVYNEEVRREVRDELNLPNNLLVIGTIGRLTRQKNPTMILKIIKDLKEKGKEFRFIWVGVGELQENIDNEIKKKGLQSEVMMLGLRNDVPRILQAMDVFIFPSIWEGLGIVAVEAQAAGLPTLCSDKVPSEAKVTNLCKFISIDSTEPWIEEIEKETGRIRIVTTEDIISNKFDICNQSSWLQNFYANIFCNKNSRF